MSVFTLLLLASPVSQAVPLLGPATDYNVFVFNSIDVDHSNTHGRIAAGGDIYMDNYSVGGGASQSDYSVVAGGSVKFSDGTISNGGILAGGNIDLHGQSINGNVTSNALVTITPPTDGTITGITTSYAGATIPVDFELQYILLIIWEELPMFLIHSPDHASF